MGPTLVAYLRGAGAGVAGTVEETTDVVAGTTTVTVGVATTTVTVSGPGLDLPIGGGEERCTRGLKLCPPRVLTMPRPEKGRRWSEWEEEDLK